jgi:hypothetical protein
VERGRGERPRREGRGDAEHGAEDDGARRGLGHRADHGTEERPADGRTERGPDDRPAAVGRRVGHEPGQPARPGAGAADALEEARDVQQHDVLRQAEDEARDAEEREAEDDRRPRPHPGRQRAAGSAPSSVPAGYAAARTPAADLERSSSSANVGSSGATTA